MMNSTTRVKAGEDIFKYLMPMSNRIGEGRPKMIVTVGGIISIDNDGMLEFRPDVTPTDGGAYVRVDTTNATDWHIPGIRLLNMSDGSPLKLPS